MISRWVMGKSTSQNKIIHPVWMWQTRQPRHWHANFSFRCSSACRLGVSCPLKADNVGRTSSTCRDEPTGWCHARSTACLAKGCPFLRELCNHLEDMNPRIMNVKQLRFQRVTSVLEGSKIEILEYGKKVEETYLPSNEPSLMMNSIIWQSINTY